MKKLLFVGALVLSLLPFNALAAPFHFFVKNIASEDIVRISIKGIKIEGFKRIGRGQTVEMTFDLPKGKCSIPIWVHYSSGLLMDKNFNFCKYDTLTMSIAYN